MAQLRELDNERIPQEEIEKRAYEIYLQHKGEAGHELEDWLIAEQELKQERAWGGSAQSKRRTVITG